MITHTLLKQNVNASRWKVNSIVGMSFVFPLYIDICYSFNLFLGEIVSKYYNFMLRGHIFFVQSMFLLTHNLCSHRISEIQIFIYLIDPSSF